MSTLSPALMPVASRPMAQRFPADFGSFFRRKKLTAAAFFCGAYAGLGAKGGHVLRRSKHPDAGPACHAGRSARTATSQRDASRVLPAWSGEGSVRPLAVANTAGPVAAICRAQPAAHLGGKTGVAVVWRAYPPTAHPWAIKRGKAAAAPGEPITGITGAAAIPPADVSMGSGPG